MPRTSGSPNPAKRSPRVAAHRAYDASRSRARRSRGLNFPDEVHEPVPRLDRVLRDEAAFDDVVQSFDDRCELRAPAARNPQFDSDRLLPRSRPLVAHNCVHC
nr:hypothetical protein [Haloferax sp. ATB1]